MDGMVVVVVTKRRLLLLAVHEQQRIPLVAVVPLSCLINQVVIVLHNQSVYVIGRGQGRVLLVYR